MIKFLSIVVLFFSTRSASKASIQLEELNTIDVVRVVELGYHFKDTVQRSLKNSLRQALHGKYLSL